MAGADTSPPVLLGLALDSTSTTAGGAPIRFLVDASDESGEVASVTLQLDRAFVSGGKSQSSVSVVFGAGAAHFTDGSESASTYVTLDEGTSTGTYVVQQAVVVDTAGNQSTYTTAQLSALHVATSFTVNAPLSPPPAPPTLYVGILNQGGLEFISNWTGYPTKIEVHFDHPLDPSQPASDTFDIYYSEARFYKGLFYSVGESEASFPISAKPGTYHITSFTANYHSSETVTSTNVSGPPYDTYTIPDTEAPRLTALSLPNTAEIPVAGGLVHVGVYASDSSDISSIVLSFDHVLGITYAGGTSVEIGSVELIETATDADRNLTYISGSGGYFVDLPLSGSDSGTYSITSVRLVDTAGNARTVTPSAFFGSNSFTIDKPEVPEDLNGDGHSDIVWRNTNGALSTWLVGGTNGTAVQQSAYNAQIDPAWKAVETFDFNGDGYADLLWRHANGTFSIWDGTSGGFQQGTYTDSSVVNAWQLAAAGDVNGDGKGDLLWRNQDGSISMWTSTGAGFIQNSYFHASVGTNWKVEGLADLNGDGKADIVWRNDNGAISTWLSTGSGFQESVYNSTVASSWHVAALADFNGDGRADILWRNDDGALSLWRSNGAGFDQSVYNALVATSWHVASTGDFNGDGKSDILWANDNGAVSTWQSNGNGFDQGIYNGGAATSWHIVGHDFPI